MKSISSLIDSLRALALAQSRKASARDDRAKKLWAAAACKLNEAKRSNVRTH